MILAVKHDHASDWPVDQRFLRATRFGRIQHLLQLIDRRARASEIALVALKGVALHACGLYAAGERPMADDDLLVRESEAQRAEQLLTELGFHATSPRLSAHRARRRTEKASAILRCTT